MRRNLFKLLYTSPARLQKSIQNKVFVVLFLLGFLSLSLLGSISVWLARREVQKEVLERNRQLAVLVSDQVQSQFSTIINNLTVEADGFGSVDLPNNSQPLIYLKLTNPGLYQSLILVNSEGQATLRVDGEIGNTKNFYTKTDPAPDVSRDAAFVTTRQGRNYFSPVNFGIDGKTSMRIAVPVKNQQGQFTGSIIAEISLSRLTEIVDQVRIGKTSTLMIVDAQGRIVAHPEAQFVGTVIKPKELREASVLDIGTSQYQGDNGESYLVGHAPVGNASGWGVIVMQNADDAFSGINRLSLIAIAIIVAAIIITSLIAVWLSRSITRPVRELATAANRITTTGNLDDQIPITSQDEVGELTASFNGMILALRKTRQALEHWNRELEHKVDVRTRQLTATNSQLEETNSQLERANLHKSQFLANMSHELRTPLNAIIGFSEVLQDQVFGELNEKQCRYVNNILSSGRHLLQLVNDVLDLSKVEAGKMELHWEEFSCRNAIGDVKTQLGALAAKKEIEIETQFSDNLNLVMADRGRFNQIFYNLLSNAIKFTPQNGTITITGVATSTNSPEKPAVAVFSVKDSGIGIAPEHLDTIFESFRQVDNTYSRQYQGTGLGLALTRKLIEMHGGRIWVESEVGVGSTFSFSLPLVTPCDVPVEETSATDQLPATVR